MRTTLERIVHFSRLAAIAAFLAGCGSKPAAPTTLPAPQAAATPAAPAAPAARAAQGRKPEIGAWGFDLGGMDRSVAPGADFYHYANGHWLASTPIPADKPFYAMFIALADRSRERTREILEASSGAPGSDGQRVGDYYKAFMDEAAIEAKGTAPIQPMLDAIARLKDKAGVVGEFAAAARRLGNSPFFTVVAQDDRAPETHIANLFQSGLGLPDRDMYD